MHERKKFGNAGEQAACTYLVRHGYEILAAPWRFLPYGEIDIVAREGHELVFVEVKTRRDIAFGYPEEAVNMRKREKIVRLIEHYLQHYRVVRTAYRFDIIAIVCGSERPKITHLKSVGVFS